MCKFQISTTTGKLRRLLGRMPSAEWLCLAARPALERGRVVPSQGGIRPTASPSQPMQ